MANYREAPLASRPETLSPDYYDVSPEKRRLQEARAAIRANLKRQYQLKISNPFTPTEQIEDPAITRWVYARANIYPHFRPTYKTSLLGGLFLIAPVIILYWTFKSDRDKKEAQIKAGTLNRNFSLSS
ncbi:NADH dehydrogenase [ubiquinone] 1 beta subcomplex subunit 4 [Stegastes partitus]|nr:PREDICTED: NADH dehydrogenase [ubiquinone] 1 beta subcomplex subunit 4 [Stegastes partitus]